MVYGVLKPRKFYVFSKNFNLSESKSKDKYILYHQKRFVAWFLAKSEYWIMNISEKPFLQTLTFNYIVNAHAIQKIFYNILLLLLNYIDTYFQSYRIINYESLKDFAKCCMSRPNILHWNTEKLLRNWLKWIYDKKFEIFSFNILKFSMQSIYKLLKNITRINYIHNDHLLNVFFLKTFKLNL